MPDVDAVREIATLLAAVAAAPVALAAAARVPVINRPGRWLWCRIVTEPLTTWLHRTLATSPLGQQVVRIEHEVHTNDGSSLRDVADRIETRLTAGDAHMTRLDEQVAEVSAQLAGIGVAAP